MGLTEWTVELKTEERECQRGKETDVAKVPRTRPWARGGVAGRVIGQRRQDARPGFHSELDYPFRETETLTLSS